METDNKPAFDFRKATTADVKRIWEIILQAKAQMYREGKHQWDEQYPAVETIENDIKKGYGYVLCNASGIIAYGAVVFDGEPTYQDIDGQWLSKQSYVVLHRLAVADEAKRQGVAGRFFDHTIDLARSKNVKSFKVDTNEDNFYMQRLLKRKAFETCGTIHYLRGDRIAFEKLI